MANNLTSRVEALELKVKKSWPEVFRIICWGATPTPEEQRQIDDAEAQGMFVICRLIVAPRIA